MSRWHVLGLMTTARPTGKAVQCVFLSIRFAAELRKQLIVKVVNTRDLASRMPS